MRDISNLITAVTLESTMAASAVQALIAAQQHLADAQAQIIFLRQQVDTSTVDPDQITKLLDTVSTTTAQLSAAIPANTVPAAGTVAVVAEPSLVTAQAGAGAALGVAVTGTDAALQARDAAAATDTVIGTAPPATPGAFPQPTETATAGLAAGPGPAVAIVPVDQT